MVFLVLAATAGGGYWLYLIMRAELPPEKRVEKFEKTPAEKAITALGWTLGQEYVPTPEKCDRNEGENRKPGLQCEESGVTLHVSRKSHKIFMIQKPVLDSHFGEELTRLKTTYGHEPKEYIDAEEGTKRLVFSLPEAAAMLMCELDPPTEAGAPGAGAHECHGWYLIYVSDPGLEAARGEFKAGA
jgi:hypothetical protein